MVITGAAGGLGSAMAQAFSSAGAQLALIDIDERHLAEVRAGLEGADVSEFPCDLTDWDRCQETMREIIDRFGGVDVLINNAGLTHRSAFADTDVSVFRRVMDVNYFGMVHMTKAALPAITERRGAIVAISSVAGFAPLLGRTGYAASKHAIHGLAGSLRAELAGTGVDVTIVAPTFVDTPFRHRTLDGDGSITKHPQSRVGRMLSPDAVAAAVVDAVERRQRFRVLGTVGELSWLLNRLSPALYERVMARSLRSELRDR